MNGLMALVMMLAASGDELPVLPDLPFKGHCEAEAAKFEARARADEAIAKRAPLIVVKGAAGTGESAMAKARDAGRAAHLAQQAAQCAMHCGRR